MLICRLKCFQDEFCFGRTLAKAVELGIRETRTKLAVLGIATRLKRRANAIKEDRRLLQGLAIELGEHLVQVAGGDIADEAPNNEIFNDVQDFGEVVRRELPIGIVMVTVQQKRVGRGDFETIEP